MITLRILLATICLIVVTYTVPVVAENGLDLLPIFFGDIVKMQWPGQFNLDFLGFLTLTATWLAWRHRFSAAGVGLGLCVFAGGIPFVTAYLFWHSLKPNSDVSTLLIGEVRA